MALLNKISTWIFSRPLPYESQGSCPAPDTARLIFRAGIGLAALEALAFALGGAFSISAAYLWIALGVTSVCFMLGSYLSTLLADARKLSFWGLLPLIAGAPLCFWNIRSYAYLNTEALSEVQSAFEQLARSDLGYTQMFWFSYPSRSLLLALVPSFFVDPSPLGYRLGFGIPMLLGSLFLYTGLRRFYAHHYFAAPLAAATASLLFAFPMLCEFTRTFEMVITSTSFGIWAIAATLLLATGPSLLSAIACAWCLGLLPASFTSGFALVALLWVILGAWILRARAKSDRPLASMLTGILLYGVVVGIALYSQQPRLLHAQQISFAEMFEKFQEGLRIVLSFGKPSFMPSFFTVPMCLVIVWALSFRGGLLPAFGIAWCLPVIWSAVTMQGKIAPQLPFCLYRALVIVPVVLFVFCAFAMWVTVRMKPARHLLSLLVLVGLGVAAFASRDTYRQHRVIGASRPALGREAIAEALVKILPAHGLRAGTPGLIVNRFDEPSVENFLPCVQYLLHGWQRVQLQEPLPLEALSANRPIVIVANDTNAVLSENIGAHQRTLHHISIPRHEKPNIDITVAVLLPNPI